jgi:hypothetical protein
MAWAAWDPYGPQLFEAAVNQSICTLVAEPLCKVLPTAPGKSDSINSSMWAREFPQLLAKERDFR